MPKTKISEFSSTPASNTDIDSINIAEGCAPSGINDAIRELMSQLKDFQTGAVGDSFNGPVGTSTAAAGAFTTLAASGAVTLSGGTANGVTYLNGSKVLTSGSALTFDGSNLGIGGNTLGSTLRLYAVQASGEGNPTLDGSEIGVFQRNFVSAQSGALAVVSGSASTSSLYLGNKNSIGAGRVVYDNSANALAFYTGASEQMRLTSTGLGIGTSSPAAKFETYNSAVNAAFVPNTLSTWRVAQIRNDGTANAGSASGIAFVGRTDVQPAGIAAIQSTTGGGNVSLSFMYVGGNTTTEGMRIDSSGNLLVGTTSAVGKLSVLGNAGGTCATFNANSNTVTPVGIIVGANDTTQAALYVYSGSNGLFNAYIYSNGNLQNRNNSYGGISDAKLKENIVDTTSKLADLMQVKVRNYNLIGDTTKQIGVVAQELETVFPAMVEESPDRDAEGNALGTTTKSVKYSVFVPMLIKAIQEQQAIIDSLKARLDAANL